MLLNGGELDGCAHPGPEDRRADDVEPRRNACTAMTAARLRPRVRDDRARRRGRPAPTRSARTGGGAPTTRGTGWIRTEKLVAVFMTQLIPATGVDLQDKFRVPGVPGDRRARAPTGEVAATVPAAAHGVPASPAPRTCAAIPRPQAVRSNPINRQLPGSRDPSWSLIRLRSGLLHSIIHPSQPFGRWWCSHTARRARTLVRLSRPVTAVSRPPRVERECPSACRARQ